MGVFPCAPGMVACHPLSLSSQFTAHSLQLTQLTALIRLAALFSSTGGGRMDERLRRCDCLRGNGGEKIFYGQRPVSDPKRRLIFSPAFGVRWRTGKKLSFGWRRLCPNVGRICQERRRECAGPVGDGAPVGHVPEEPDNRERCRSGPGAPPG